ncbi:putative knottin, scorpion toxin, defensin, plant, knottin, scorpion toxin-like superfamily [Helianthus annuus]|nr:putative knottin, scorpion toxin, defensin, plant, knottin, scorpion toxin-like superfamily [Helianthus annuus]
MKSSIMKLFAALLLVVMCLLANEMGGPIMVEARTCLSQSRKFKGACFSDNNCGNVCKSEGFPRGKCRGFRRRCFCVKHC